MTSNSALTEFTSCIGKMAVDDLIDTVTVYEKYPRSIKLAWGFFNGLSLVGVYYLLYCWIFSTAIREDYITIVIGLLAIYLITFLSIVWSVHVRCSLTCKKVTNPLDGDVVKVVPTANNGYTELVELTHKKKEDEVITTFYFQKTKYIWCPEKKQFTSLQFPVDKTFRQYLEWKGYADDDCSNNAAEHYGINALDMVVPSFSELFTERATAPFFVFQVLCVVLWCLDRYWYYSLFTLVMLFVFECTLVNQQMRNMAEIRNMGNKPFSLQVYRSRRWKTIQSDHLVPGDIVSIGRSHNNPIPCDLLLLRGPCIVDESLLTGESIPQMKEPIENFDPEKVLDTDGDGKLHILFGGTKVVQHTPPSKTSAGIRAQDNGCVAYVLRTSFNTSQGKLLRTILFGVKRITANNLETLAFILFLLIFAVAAAAYVWIKGSEDPKRNRYSLLLECILILTSVIPPELPVELSLAVNASLMSLGKLGVFCTEPFRIPFAGKVQICCFDKTGTLTSNDLILEGIAGIATENKYKVMPLSEAPETSVYVLATCHSLIQLEEGLVGDPLEKTTLLTIDWNLTKGEAVIPKRGRYRGMKIFHRFHFSSTLKRMSVLAGYTLPGNAETNYISSVKGAPETLKSMFVSVDDDYDSIYLGLSRRGARVLALGFKEFGHLSHQQVKDISRESLESDLIFAGFIVVSCPLKIDSKEVIKELLGSTHMVVMITGDNPLTACHVAKELLFTRKQLEILLLTYSMDKWYWQSIDEQTKLPVEFSENPNAVTAVYDLCVTGDGLMYLSENAPEYLRKIFPHISIFARVSPKQKEFVIVTLKSLGFSTLMCGDGTNDVGALKQADVGVALISTLPERSEPPKTTRQSSRSEKSKIPTVANHRANDRMLTNRQYPDRTGAPMNRAAMEKEMLNAKLDKLLKEMDDGQPKIVKLGDASIAAPFTSKLSSVQCICHIIKQGRCTLVTTLQMFKILALNALILAYGQSVLYVAGIKFSDMQATLQGILLAGCFLFISRSQPLKTLSAERPLPNIFNVYTISTVLLQFLVHLSSLIFLVHQATYNYSPSLNSTIENSTSNNNTDAIEESPANNSTFDNPDEEFKPNIVNSTVYIMSAALQVATFAINYRGKPFMISLTENKSLLYTLQISAGMVVMLVLGVSPSFNESFDIVEFPYDFRLILILVLIADFALSYALDRICRWLFGEGNLTTH